MAFISYGNEGLKNLQNYNNSNLISAAWQYNWLNPVSSPGNIRNLLRGWIQNTPNKIHSGMNPPWIAEKSTTSPTIKI
jgi:hypothetical protein